MAKKINRWWLFAIILWIITGIGLLITYMIRAKGGIETYFSVGWIIMLNSFMYVLFFGLTTGLIVGFILKKAKK